VLLYGSETWTNKARDARRITAAETKYMRTVGYIWADYKTNGQIAKKLKITPILDKLLEYKRNWIQVNRMPHNRLPRVIKHYSPTGRRNHGRDFWIRETGTGQVAQIHDRYYICRSQWPCDLRRRSPAARLLRLWVRIPTGAWMFVTCVAVVR
jgi:hypothetical protein